MEKKYQNQVDKKKHNRMEKNKLNLMEKNDYLMFHKIQREIVWCMQLSSLSSTWLVLALKALSDDRMAFYRRKMAVDIFCQQ
uniref:Uncharacterized protein n=1 Tax=Cannabis sativa TaxID=3483 RepID=A0A803QIP3_CANSA